MNKRTMILIMGLMAMAAVSVMAATPETHRMPLAFTKNVGQWDERVLFRANSGGATMWFTREGVTYQFTRHVENNNTPLNPLSRGDSLSHTGTAMSESIPLLRGVRGVSDGDSIEQLVLTAKFVGANPNFELVGEGLMVYKCNYFLGNDPAKWHTDVPNYETITLKDIYPGIDLKYSDDGNGQAAYKFIVEPGADVEQVKVEYEGVQETSVDSDGRLVMQTKWGDMTAAIRPPTSSTLSGVASFSQLSNRMIGFEGDAETRLPSGTDSVELVYSTYLGGGGDDVGSSITVDGNDNAFVTGETTSLSFPTLNPYQTDQGGVDIFVTKLSSNGNSLIYSTYIGGNGNEYDWNQGGIAVDGSGNAYLVGTTESSDFPTLNPYQTYQGGNDVFVVKLSSTGNNLIYSTYLGTGGDDHGNDIAVDESGNAYVTGHTASATFPTLNPYQLYPGGWSAFVTKLSISGSTLAYSTYLGGAGDDVGYGIAVDGSGNAYVTGWTYSSDFPTLNPYLPTYQGSLDGFVTKLATSGASLVYSTYLGGGGGDVGFGIAVDGSGNAYVTGETHSSDFPILDPFQTAQGGMDAFVTKLSSSGSSLIYSTYLGGVGEERGSAIGIDGNGCAFVAGETMSLNFPTQNPYQTHQGGGDVFATEFSSSGNFLIYSTYLGGAGSDVAYGVAVDVSGNAYVTGYTESLSFPTVNSYQSTFQGGDYDVFVAKLHKQPVNHPPAVDAVSDMMQREGDTVSFLVSAIDPDSTIPTLTAFILPVNAVFFDSGNGHGGFYWPIAPKQYGTFNISFVASDSVLADTETVEIQVSARLPELSNVTVAGSLTPEHVMNHLPTITWRYYDFAGDDPQLKFEIAVGTDSDWTYAEMWNPAPFNSADTFVVYNGSPLADGATYWLRLRVNNALAWSDWKQISFHMNSIPTLPQLRLPLPGALVPVHQPELVIRNSSDAESDSLLFTFQVSPDSFLTTVYTFTKKQSPDSLTALIVDSVLAENARYWWRVKASDYYEQSDYSETRSFWINGENSLPTPFVLILPPDTSGGPLTTLLPRFVWSPSSDPDPLDGVRYSLNIALDANFNFVNTIDALTATSYTLTADDSLSWGTRYWWKVRAYDYNGGNTWSTQVLTFRTITLGDANNDGEVDISDAVYLIAYIFSGGPAPSIAGDANCDHTIDISDAVYLIAFIFSGGPEPCAAF